MRYKKILLVFVILIVAILLVFFINAQKKEADTIMKIRIESADGEEQEVIVDKAEDVEIIKEQLRELGYLD
jgi:hypothetical protein